MKKKVLFLAMICALCLALATPSLAASNKAAEAAAELNSLGLMTGVGTNADGTIDFDLDRAPTRAEAVALLVRLLGRETEATARNWSTPFTDVSDWSADYVGYAYANNLTAGISKTVFGGNEPVSAAQYLTFVLRALGYVSGTDFRWDRAWELTDRLGITGGQYGAFSPFTRGDVAIVSAAALKTSIKNQSKILLEIIQERQATAEQWIIRGTVALPDGFTHYMDITGFCYGFNTESSSISAYFCIPSGQREGTFEFRVPAKQGAKYEFYLEVHTDCGLVQSGLNLGMNGVLGSQSALFTLTKPETDLGVYTLIRGVTLSGTIRLPEGGSIAGEYISGFVRAQKPGEGNGPQTRFELYAAAGSTQFSINLPDNGPYMLSIYLGTGGSNLYTGELYQKAQGLLPGASGALTFSVGDQPELILRRGFTVQGTVTLPASAAGPCSIDVFASNRDGTGNGVTICNLRPGESAPFRFSLLSPSDTLRFGYRLSGNPGPLLANQAIYTDGQRYSSDSASVTALDTNTSVAYINITPVAQLS